MGMVAQFFVESGVVVADDELIMQIECMKMLYDIRASCAGTVSVFVALGQQIAQDQLLAIIKS
jgi:biotin carboxyl carrier protein